MTTRARRGSSEASGAPDAIGVSGHNTGVFINLTQHEVRLMRDGQPDLVLPPKTPPARVVFDKVGSFQGVDILQRVGEVEELPPPDPSLNTFFIVSRMVKDAVPRRIDVVVPYGLFTDATSGRVRCRGVAL